MELYHISSDSMPTSGRIYTVNPAPEVTGDDQIIAYRWIDKRGEWFVVHADTGGAIAYGTTRKGAVTMAARALRRAGRASYLAAVDRATKNPIPNNKTVLEE